MERHEKTVRERERRPKKGVPAQPASPVRADVLLGAEGYCKACGYSGTFEREHHAHLYYGNRRKAQTADSKARTCNANVGNKKQHNADYVVMPMSNTYKCFAYSIAHRQSYVNILRRFM